MAPLSPTATTFHKPLSTPFPLFLLSIPVTCIRSQQLISPPATSFYSSAVHGQRQSLCFPSGSHAPRRGPTCHAVSPGPPPDSDPPPPNDSVSLTGLVASLSKFQDRVQVFFAVLFWMSLFFWASAWDGRSRPNKGSRFRK